MKRVWTLFLVASLAVSTFIPLALAAESAPVVSMTITKSIKSVSYKIGDKVKIDFKGTALIPKGEGEATVKNEDGRCSIDASFKELVPPTDFGPYLVYVLWSITPDGRTNNLGQVILDGKKAEINVTTRLPAFGLMVTAEPYFAVSYPSEMVVLENEPRKDTKGVSAVDANIDLLQRGVYKELPAVKMDPKAKIPIELYEARYAMAVAKNAKAETYAADNYAKASAMLQGAETMQMSKKSKDRKTVPTTAREATQAFEDTRTIAIKREQAAAMKAQADAAAEAKAAAAAAEQQKMLAQQQAASAQQQAADSAQAAATADAARQAAMAGQAQAQAQAAAATRSANQMRADLLKQFNAVLPTTDTPRGLVVNMGGVLFSSGSYELRPPAREALAKLSGIVATQPSLKLSVEGHTDNTGSPETNMKLSGQRANTVRDFLIKQGLTPDSITATGMGMADPIASNDTPEGRGANRRVEIVVSGTAIGTSIGK